MLIIEEFIKRRFPNDSNWLSGNCYHFASVLSSVFSGELYYDVVAGHFLFKLSDDNCYYDWSGKVTNYGHLVKWKDFDEYDALQRERIVRDCIE